MIVLALCLMWLTPDNEALLRRAAEIPASKRMERVLELSGGQPESPAWRDYAAASDAMVTWFNLAVSQDAESSALADAIEQNMGRMLLTDDWTISQEFMIRRYLELNAEALALIRRATDRPILGLPAEGILRPSALNFSHAIRPFTAGRLALLKAADDARRGEWKQAWEWNHRAACCTQHLMQLASVIARGAAWASEARQRAQALAFVHRAPEHAPRDPLWRDAAAAARTASWDAVTEAELLLTLDYTERLAAWASGAADEEIGSIVEVAVAGLGDEEGKGALGDGGMRFDSVAEFRKAMRGWTSAKQLETEVALGRIYADWNQRPFHECLREIRERGDEAELRRRVRAALIRSPASRLFHGVFSQPPEHSRRRAEHSRMTAAAVSAIVKLTAHQQRHGVLPKSLAEVCGAELPLDSYSGTPLVYRQIGDAEFTLYSVGFDGDDDGGRVTPIGGTEDGDYVFWPPVVPKWVGN
ncbi:MAG: hypothetical protein HRU75_08025 [Planctomycetia bacterium]|nr:MAG: hypothetical protein HRU75_08025 [Planctomycetia bacterium]